MTNETPMAGTELNAPANLVPRTARRLETGLDCSADRHLCKQSFKKAHDINNVLLRSQTGVGLSHLANFGHLYGDFSDWTERTYEDMQARMAAGVSIFNDLPAELRAEFDHNPGKFFEVVNTKTPEELEELYPILSQPGMQFPDVLGTIANTIQEAVAAASTDAPTEPPDATDQPDAD